MGSKEILGVFRAYRFGRDEKMLRICRDFFEVGHVILQLCTSQIYTVHKRLIPSTL